MINHEGARKILGTVRKNLSSGTDTLLPGHSAYLGGYIDCLFDTQQITEGIKDLLYEEFEASLFCDDCFESQCGGSFIRTEPNNIE